MVGHRRSVEYVSLSIDNTFAGSKGLKGLYFVKIGAMEGRGRKLLGSANFPEHWHPLPKEKMHAQVKALKQKFSELPYGPFHAISQILGKQRARELAASRLCTAPPSEGNLSASLVPIVSTIGGKRPRQDSDGGVSDGEIDSDDSVQSKRARLR
jgi:hypothetical protein